MSHCNLHLPFNSKSLREGKGSPELAGRTIKTQASQRSGFSAEEVTVPTKSLHRELQ